MSAETAVPIAFTATRYRCPFCSRSRSSRKATAAHIDRCWHNPAARGCKTCANYIAAEPDCGEYGCNGCGSDECCAANASDLDNGPIIHCDRWESEDAT